MPGFFCTLKNKTVAFIGAGVAHRELIPMFARAGARVALCDKSDEETIGRDYIAQLAALGVRLCLGPAYLDCLADQQMILRTPGFEYYTPELQAAKDAGAEITSEIELFFQYAGCPIIGITGSDGKTTTTSLVAAMLQAAGRTVHLGGNIGRAMLPIVDEVKETDIAVVELSSFQLISMRVSPHIAVITNITPNHLDHHRDMEEYIDAKRNIIAWQGKNDIAVLGYENQITRGMELDVVGHRRWFTRLREVEDGAFQTEDGLLCLAEQGVAMPVVNKSEVKLRGAHNIENLLAAFAAVRDEVPLKAMQQVAREFTGVEHRIEPVRTVNGVQWFNDSIASSPTRVIAGLRAFDQKLILLAGGYDKNLDYAPMVPDALDKVKLIILMGQTADKIEGALRADPKFEDSGMRILRAENMDEAVKLAAKNAQPGDVVTLSPASASFDAYPNFEVRGRHYKALVNAL